jgi:hypothetical protein
VLERLRVWRPWAAVVRALVCPVGLDGQRAALDRVLLAAAAVSEPGRLCPCVLVVATRRPSNALVYRHLLSSAVIMLAVRWYLRLGLSYRDVEELLAERGIEVDHVMVYAGSSGSVPLLAEPLGLACLGGGP